MVDGVFDERAMTGRRQDEEAHLIVGLVFIGLGIMPLASGLYGYCATLLEVEGSQETVREMAGEF